MRADYGGTQIRSALTLALGSRDTFMPTVVFVLTDGEVRGGFSNPPVGCVLIYVPH